MEPRQKLFRRDGNNVNQLLKAEAIRVVRVKAEAIGVSDCRNE